MQVSRLGNPLFNEVIVPIGDKDELERGRSRSTTSEFAKYVKQPELAKLLPVLYPGVFPNLAAYTKDRADLDAILLTGIPAGVVPGFQNFTGPTPADMLRLNVAIPPTTPKPEPARPGRRRPGRLPERAAGVRRHRRDRAEGGGRARRSRSSTRATRRTVRLRWSRPTITPGDGPLPGHVPVSGGRPTTDTTRLRREPQPRPLHGPPARARDARSRAGGRGPRPPHRCGPARRGDRDQPCRAGRRRAPTSRSTSGRSPAGSLYGAVFDSLPAGEYTLWLDDRPLRRDVAVAGAAVTDISIKEEHE